MDAEASLQGGIHGGLNGSGPSCKQAGYTIEELGIKTNNPST